MKITFPQGSSLREPWAEISERLRRNLVKFQTDAIPIFDFDPALPRSVLLFLRSFHT